MWNVFYENGSFHWYAYPFIYGVAGSLFLALSVAVARARMTTVPSGELPLRRVLDMSFVFFVIFYLCSKAGSVLYVAPEEPLGTFADFSQKGQATHVGVFVLGLVAFFTPKGWGRLTSLWQVWAGPSLIASGVGYIGCLCYGCCFGCPVVEDAWYTIRFPIYHNAAGDIIGAPALIEQMKQGILDYGAQKSLPVHAVQVYHSVLLCAGGAVFTFIALRYRWDGLFVAAVTFYMIVRVVLDTVRGDHEPEMSPYAQAPNIRIGMAVVLGFALMVTIKRGLGWRTISSRG